MFYLLLPMVLHGQSMDIGDAPPAPVITVPKLSLEAPAAAIANWYDTTNRAAIRDSWNLVLMPTLSVPMGWSGDVVLGIPGNTSPAWKDAVDTRINWFRAMAGVPPVITIDPTFSAKDQQAAMMFSVNQQISHFPPTTWINYTVDGAEAARNSNICIGFVGDPGCVLAYLVELGSNNSAVGHRRWLLYPQTRLMGTGDVPPTGQYPYANALWVFDGNFGSTRPATRAPYVAWPPPGYIPYQVAGPRWSFSYPNADFSTAMVTMTRQGVTVPVRLEPVQNGFGENTLVWVPDNLDTSAWQANPPAADITSTVTVNNVSIGGVLQNFSYSVTVFDPNSQQSGSFTFTPPSAMTPNTGGVGSTSLTVSPAGISWSAVSSAAWLTITSAASGTGTSMISWSALPNPSSLARSASITAGTAAYLVTQTGTPCSYSFARSSTTLPMGGGSGSVTVTATPSDCAISYTYSAGLTVSSSVVGAGTFNLSYSAGANTTGVSRIFTISIGAESFTIVQAGSQPTGPIISNVGILRGGFLWLLDVDGNRQFIAPPDKVFAFGGVPGDIPLSGDWNGDGHTKAGIYRSSNGVFILDYDGDGQFTSADKVYNLGVGTQPGDVPVAGDWNGDGRTKVGLFRQGFFWILDTNGNGTFESGDSAFAFGGIAGDVPVTGDWNGTGTAKVGVFRSGFLWVLDTNGSHTLDAGDQVFAFGGIAGDMPVVGDWNGDGRSKVGVFRAGFFWVLDTNGSQVFDAGSDQAFAFGGISGDKPVIGKW
jgi:hypothetical protein